MLISKRYSPLLSPSSLDGPLRPYRAEISTKRLEEEEEEEEEAG
jgi:hypothetical protein